MKISDDTKAKLKCVKSPTLITTGPLTLLLKLFALNCYNKSSNTKLILLKSFFAALVLGTMSFLSLYYKIAYVNHSIGLSIWLTDAVQMIFDCCQYIVDLYIVYRYGRHIILVYYKHYECIDNILNIFDNSSVKWRMNKLLGSLTLIWMFSSGCDFAAWVLSYGWIVPIVYSVSYIFLYIKIITILNLTCHVMLIEDRLNIIGDILEHVYYSTDAALVMNADFLNNAEWLYSCMGTRGLPLKPRFHKPFDENSLEMKSIIRCYLLLTEQVALINNIHGFRILLNLLSLLIDMVRFANLAIRLGSGSQQVAHASAYFPAFCSLMRLLTCVVIIMSLVNYCERAYRQKERIVNIIDHLLINKKPGENLRRVVTEFRGFVQQRPISFNMAHVFVINYSLLMSIASVVVTYTIILLQSVN